MKKTNGLSLKVKNLHIHLDEHTEIRNEYGYPQPGEAEMDCCCDDCGCDKDDDADDTGEEDSCESFTEEDIVKEVCEETGFPKAVIRKVLDSQAEMLVKHLLGEIVKPRTRGRKAGV